MIITIGGNMGAGKSTVAPLLADALQYKHVYMGGIFRMMAQQKMLTIEAFYKELEKNPDLERSVDAEQIELMKENDDIIVQGRNSFFFAKQSGKAYINIFFAVDPTIGAQRKIDEGIYPKKTAEEVIAIHQHREAEERKHYKSLYDIEDHLDPKNYSFIIDTSHITANETLQQILEKIKHKN